MVQPASQRPLLRTIAVHLHHVPDPQTAVLGVLVFDSVHVQDNVSAGYANTLTYAGRDERRIHAPIVLHLLAIGREELQMVLDPFNVHDPI